MKIEQVKSEVEAERTQVVHSDDPEFPALKLKAKAMYLEHKPIAHISKELKLGINTVKAWVYGQGKKIGWQSERELQQTQVLKELTQEKAVKLKEAANMTVDLIWHYVKRLSRSPDDVDLKTADKLASMLTNLSKITQIDKDEEDPADSNSKPSTVEDLRRKLNADPFSEVIEEPSQEPNAQS